MSLQESHEVLWRLFAATGQIGAYLLYRELLNDSDNGGDSGEERNQYS
ncbi:MAG TPA: YqzL family protein [Firmicutes bacterium]|nr:YqzL family protein [Bacillota bacterium]